MTKVTIVLGCLGTHGPSLVRAQLATEMIRRGVTVDIVLGQDPFMLAPSLFPNCSVQVLGTQRPRHFIGKLMAHLKKARPDGVLASSWPFSVATILAVHLYNPKLPVVISEHSDFRSGLKSSSEFTNKDKFLLRYVAKYIYNRANRIVGVSQGVLDGLVDKVGVSRRNMTVISNPARRFTSEPAEKPEESQRLERFWAQGALKLLAVGRLVPEKDYGTMIKAVSILKTKLNIKLVIVGSGHMREALESQINHLGLEQNVMLAGQSNTMSHYYGKADLFLLSSSCEGFGNVLVEALSFGLPIVSTDCKSGPSEILANGKYGFLTPVGDAVAFAKGVEKALATSIDPKAQKSRAAHFSIETATDRYLSALFSKSSEI
jgi:glycosyltransferase involved in cell wall biosynthesis